MTVNVGEILECHAGEDIRTRGCDPCVALIAIYTLNGVITKRCAHFSVGIPGRLNQVVINAALNPVLQANFPLVNLTSAGFTWGGRTFGMGGDLIYNRLNQYFAGHINVQGQQADSLTTNGLGIQILNQQVWPWTNIPAANAAAELN